MRHHLFSLALITGLLTACGGSDDTSAPSTSDSAIAPIIAKCGPLFPTVASGQTYAVAQVSDRLDASGTGRIARFYALGTNIPTNRDYGQIYLTPRGGTQNPVTQIRVHATEFSDCNEAYIGSALRSDLSANETIESLSPNAYAYIPADPNILKHYILDAIHYSSSSEKNVEFHIDASRYASDQALDENALKICSIASISEMVRCPDVTTHRNGQTIIASATIPSEHFAHLVLASTQPRGFETLAASNPDPVFERSYAYLPVDRPSGYPQVCGENYASIAANFQGYPAILRGESHQFNTEGAGVFSDFTFFGTQGPDEYSYHASVVTSYLDAQIKLYEKAEISMAAWADCAHGRMTNLQRNIHANETIASFARNKNFGGEMQYQNLHVLEGFAYSGFDPHI
ncbi:hypothetical protein EII18_12955, partial [Comamonadaceae bacterium OH3737_COT-264]